jgi:anti-sigma regulatory factor (Ser/Thr protein kinase)
MTGIVLASAEPLLGALARCGAAFAHGHEVTAATSLSRSSIQQAALPLRALFVVNPSASWSLGRIDREVRARTADATVAAAFMRPPAVASQLDAVVTRWVASTPHAFVDDALGWSRFHHIERFDADTATPGAARRFVRRVLEQWGRSDLIEPAALVTSELTTNAVLHARRGPIEVTVACGERNDDEVQIVVADSTVDRLPIWRRPTAESRSGRGLRIVDATARRWGITVTPQHKRVWCDLSADLPVHGA